MFGRVSACAFVVNKTEQMQARETRRLSRSEASRHGCELHAKEVVCINLPKCLAKVCGCVCVCVCVCVCAQSMCQQQ